jgi:rhamnogalacturonyl hydrolase YesR/lysophospholipase L1-like esterase
MKYLLILTFLLISCNLLFAQKQTDTNTPLHLLKPDYKIPYGTPEVAGITKVLDRMWSYLDQNTFPELIDKTTQAPVADYSKIDKNTIFKPGDFRLISYEWGVTYAGMLLATETTGDPKYAGYTAARLKFLSEVRPWLVKLEEQQPGVRHPMYGLLHPHALDDCGAMTAAMIKVKKLDSGLDLDPIITNAIDYISNKEFRLKDGTLARNRPLPNTIWLDDLFMSVPALAQMGAYNGDRKYFDDAVKQVIQFSRRMFNYEKGLFMHGWVQEMKEHPQFHWARANGWALMSMVELLEVLPADHPGYGDVLDLLRRHIRGLANTQSSEGFWHQLLDRPDAYLETSATAIYTYSIARAINRGYVDGKVYGPMVCLAWNAVATKVNGQGQVEGTCVGTGMGFDPAFYYYRPINVYAAHGYGPVLLAGAEMISLIKNHDLRINDSALMLYADGSAPLKSWKFHSGEGNNIPGSILLTPETTWSEVKGYGLLAEKSPVAVTRKVKNHPPFTFLTSDQPFAFSLTVPEGKYAVTVTLGDPAGVSETTVKAESRRLMLENVSTAKGETVTRTFVADVRTPRINPTEQIRLKPRELNYLNWDDRLTLEFSGSRPALSSLEIREVRDLPVIYLAGNSTVTDQEEEPWASWGQMFPRFVKPEVVVANYAESGESLLSFKRELRLQKILSLIKPGDWLFIEFAHNDQKPGGNHLDPFTTYRNELKYYIGEVRKKGARPVLVTSMHRRRFDESGKIVNSLEEFPEAMRQTAKEEQVPCIDLNAMSKTLFEALGPENSKKAFVHYPANSFPGQTEPLADDTHFSNYGAYLLAQCVVKGIREGIPELTAYLESGLSPFDPAKPVPYDQFRLPHSMKHNTLRPAGN